MKKNGTGRIKGFAKRTTVNLFVDSNVLEDIRKDAQNDGVSLNARINDILTSYSLLYKYNKEQEAVFITGKSQRFFLDNIDENKFINHYIEVTADLATSMLLERNVPFTLDNVVKYLIEGVAKYSGSFKKFTLFKDEEGYTCLLFRHNYGDKWSRILGTGMCHLLEYILKCHTNLLLLSNSALIKILEKDIK
jgi:hypothetical protein